MQWVEGPPDGQPEAPPSAGPLPPLAHDEVDAAAPEPQRETARAAQASGDAAHAVDVPEIADMESPGIDSSPAGVTVVGEEARSGFDSLELGNAPLLEARSQASVAWHPETGWQQGADSTPLAAERDYAPSILAPWRYLYSAGGWRWENLLCPLWSMLLLVEAFIAWSYLTGRWLPKDLEGEEVYVLLRQPSVLVALLCMGYVAVALGTAIPVAHMFLRPADKVRLDAYVADEADIRNDTLRRSKTLMSRLQADGEGTLRGAVVDLEGIAERHAHRCVALRRGVQPDVLLWVRRVRHWHASSIPAALVCLTQPYHTTKRGSAIQLPLLPVKHNIADGLPHAAHLGADPSSKAAAKLCHLVAAHHRRHSPSPVASAERWCAGQSDHHHERASHYRRWH